MRPASENYFQTCAPGKDSDRPAHSRSLIRIFNGRILIARNCTKMKLANKIFEILCHLNKFR